MYMIFSTTAVVGIWSGGRHRMPYKMMPVYCKVYCRCKLFIKPGGPRFELQVSRSSQSPCYLCRCCSATSVCTLYLEGFEALCRPALRLVAIPLLACSRADTDKSRKQDCGTGHFEAVSLGPIDPPLSRTRGHGAERSAVKQAGQSRRERRGSLYACWWLIHDTWSAEYDSETARFV